MTEVVQSERQKFGLDHPITIRDAMTLFPVRYEKGVAVYVCAVYGYGQQQSLITAGATNIMGSGQ